MIDIIIPAYNSHKTIDLTLSSIAYQTITDELNVYIVNDASEKDYSDFVKYYSNFFKIKELKMRKNGGPGAARQYGIDHSSGDYIVFIDADDCFVDCTSLVTLKSSIEENNSDLVIASFVEEIPNRFVTRNNDTIWLHGKIYRRKYLVENNIRFNNTRANEDNGFNQLLLFSDPVVNYINDVVYIWKNNANSITRSNNKEYDVTGLEGYVYNMLWAIEEAVKRGYKHDRIKRLAFGALCEMYYKYLIYGDAITNLFYYCKKLKDVYYSLGDVFLDEASVLECQFNANYNEYNRMKLLSPRITFNEYLNIVDKEGE